MYRAIEIRINPSKAQKELLNSSFSAACFCYNWGVIYLLEKFYELNKETVDKLRAEGARLDKQDYKIWKRVNFKDLSKDFTQFKKTPKGAWLRQLDSNIGIGEVGLKGNLKKADDNFWSSPKSEAHKAMYAHLKKCEKEGKTPWMEFPYTHYKGSPSFKKYSSVGSYSTDGRQIKVDQTRVYLPKIGWVGTYNWEDLPTHWNQSITVKTDGVNYYVVFLCEREPGVLDKEQTGVIGVDLGLKYLATLPDGTHIENFSKDATYTRLNNRVKYYNNRISRLQLLNLRKDENGNPIKNERGKQDIYQSRKLKRYKLLKRKREIDLNNYKDTKMKQAVFQIVSANPRGVVFEDLSIKGMQRNKKLSSSIQQTGMSAFKTKLIDKCKEFGIEVREANRHYASSQLCSVCGFKHTAMKKLSRRTFECPNCGAVLDRDVNASLNLAKAWDLKNEKGENICTPLSTENPNSK